MKKNSFIKSILLILMVSVMISCTINQKKIIYGEDGCHYCSMTIVDKIHGAEIVTKKGKVFKFDAIECMVNYSNEIEKEDVALFLCNHYDTPEEFVDATKATFLISKNIPSPMGAYLTAFEDNKKAKKVKSDKEGKLYSWDELQNFLNR